MESNAESQLEWGRRDRLLGSLDRMVKSGRVTEDEAQALRTATDANDFNHAVGNIRVRHAGLSLDAAVADGSLSRAEAGRLLDKVREGEHGGPLRARLRALRLHRRDHD